MTYIEQMNAIGVRFDPETGRALHDPNDTRMRLSVKELRALLALYPDDAEVVLLTRHMSGRCVIFGQANPESAEWLVNAERALSIHDTGFALTPAYESLEAKEPHLLVIS